MPLLAVNDNSANCVAVGKSLYVVGAFAVDNKNVTVDTIDLMKKAPPENVIFGLYRRTLDSDRSLPLVLLKKLPAETPETVFVRSRGKGIVVLLCYNQLGSHTFVAHHFFGQDLAANTTPEILREPARLSLPQNESAILVWMGKLNNFNNNKLPVAHTSGSKKYTRISLEINNDTGIGFVQEILKQQVFFTLQAGSQLIYKNQLVLNKVAYRFVTLHKGKLKPIFLQPFGFDFAGGVCACYASCPEARIGLAIFVAHLDQSLQRGGSNRLNWLMVPGSAVNQKAYSLKKKQLSACLSLSIFNAGQEDWFVVNKHPFFKGDTRVAAVTYSIRKIIIQKNWSGLETFDFAKSENSATFTKYDVYAKGTSQLKHITLIPVVYGRLPRVIKFASLQLSKPQLAYNVEAIKLAQFTTTVKRRGAEPAEVELKSKVSDLVQRSDEAKAIVSCTCKFLKIMGDNYKIIQQTTDMVVCDLDTGILEKQALRFETDYRENTADHLRLHCVMQAITGMSDIDSKLKLPSFVLSMPSSMINASMPILYSKKDTEVINKIIDNAGSPLDVYTSYTKYCRRHNLYHANEQMVSSWCGRSVFSVAPIIKQAGEVAVSEFTISGYSASAPPVAGYVNYCKNRAQGMGDEPIKQVDAEVKGYLNGNISSKYPTFNGSLPACTKRLNFDGWIGTEKYDGVRARWNPHEKIFVVGKRSDSLSARRPPGSWLDVLDKPTMPWLDGELWCGRGRFYETMKTINSASWDNLRFVVFDTQDPAYARHTYPERMACLREIFAAPNSVASVAPSWVVKNKNDAITHLLEILRVNGEGLVVRAPNAGYGDSPIVKLKAQSEISVMTSKPIIVYATTNTCKCECFVLSDSGAVTDERLIVNGVPQNLSSGVKIVVAYASKTKRTYLHARYERTFAEN